MKEYITWKERSNYGKLLTKTIDLTISPGIIIGRGGKTIQMIENSTNTKIHILRDDNKITISGYVLKYIEAAKSKIKEIIDTHYQKYEKEIVEEEEECINFLDESNFPSIQDSVVNKNTNIHGAWGKKPNFFKK